MEEVKEIICEACYKRQGSCIIQYETWWSIGFIRKLYCEVRCDECCGHDEEFGCSVFEIKEIKE